MAGKSRSKFVQIQGKAGFSALDHPDTKYNLDGIWYIEVYPTPEGIQTVLDLQKEGLRNKLTVNDDGETKVRFSRPVIRDIGGRKRAFEPVRLEDANRLPLPRSTKIGHGSDVTVNLEVYYHKTPQRTEAAAARLAGVRIDNLIPYTRENYASKDIQATKGLDKLPVQSIQTW